jgi:hypothetical protein
LLGDVGGEHSIVLLEYPEDFLVFGADFLRRQNINGLEDLLVLLVVLELVGQFIILL